MVDLAFFGFAEREYAYFALFIGPLCLKQLFEQLKIYVILFGDEIIRIVLTYE